MTPALLWNLLTNLLTTAASRRKGVESMRADTCLFRSDTTLYKWVHIGWKASFHQNYLSTHPISSSACLGFFNGENSDISGSSFILFRHSHTQWSHSIATPTTRHAHYPYSIATRTPSNNPANSATLILSHKPRGKILGQHLKVILVVFILPSCQHLEAKRWTHHTSNYWTYTYPRRSSFRSKWF